MVDIKGAATKVEVTVAGVLVTDKQPASDIGIAACLIENACAGLADQHVAAILNYAAGEVVGSCRTCLITDKMLGVAVRPGFGEGAAVLGQRAVAATVVADDKVISHVQRLRATEGVATSADVADDEVVDGDGRQFRLER